MRLFNTREPFSLRDSGVPLLGVPMGFAFINMIEDYDKALTLDGSYLDELRLTVTMAVNRSEYYFFTNRKGCERCGIALSTHVKKQMCEKFYSRNRFPSDVIRTR
ncbi:unnamed protein product [Brassica rapa subsp. trilocularis]